MMVTGDNAGLKALALQLTNPSYIIGTSEFIEASDP